jgi:uncharacterized membrane protein
VVPISAGPNDCEKYPPSLLYLAMTLSPGLLLLAAFEGAHGRLAFGRVPFFYYVAHIFLIHALAAVLAWLVCGTRHGCSGVLQSTSPRIRA